MKKLFENVNLGSLELKNRLVRSATWENMTTEDGRMTDKLLEVYEELAKNEVALIVTGYANIVKEEQPNAGMMGIYDDSFVEEYRELIKTVHNYDSKIIMQLAYGGTKTKFNLGERVIYAPSNIPERTTGVAGKTMDKNEIDYIVEAFAKSAERVKEAGFDGVEIHAAHSYLINQFLSPYYNRRDDEYGGSLENRTRFLVEIYEHIREKVGKDFFVAVKLTACEFFDEGLSFDETREIAKKLESLGVDALEISGNIHGKASKMTGQEFDAHEIQKEGYFGEYAKVIAEEVDIPVITVGGFRSITSMEELLNSSKIGYFGLSRPLLAEADLIKRWKNGDTKKSICVSCSRCRTETGNYCTLFNRA